MSASGTDESGNEIVSDGLMREVVYTAGRAARPHDFQKSRHVKMQDPRDCFFCPGNEARTPPEITFAKVPGEKAPEGGAESYWSVRCFENKFPAVRKDWKKAYGYHEVIVETPRHRLTVSELSKKHWAAYLGVAAGRLKEHMKDRKIRYSILFKNEGREAGASLEHTHSQLVSLPYVPARIREYAKTHAKIIRRAAGNKKTIVSSNRSFFAFCPDTSQFHFEAWIAPKKAGTGSLLDLGRDEIEDLADIMQKTLASLDAITSYSPYNIVYIMAPKGARGFTMSIRIMPRLATWAGFELGCGSVMNSVHPETAAKMLRQ
ncbi:MAG: DUF4931 domain-containing protein [Candidatus Micrarchaeia archaeon]